MDSTEQEMNEMLDTPQEEMPAELLEMLEVLRKAGDDQLRRRTMEMLRISNRMIENGRNAIEPGNTEAVHYFVDGGHVRDSYKLAEMVINNAEKLHSLMGIILEIIWKVGTNPDMIHGNSQALSNAPVIYEF